MVLKKRCFFSKQYFGDPKVFLSLSAAAVALVLVACGWQQSLLALAALAVFMRRGRSLQHPLLKEGVYIIISILNSSCVIRFCPRLLFFRQLRALWLCVWHLAVSPWALEAFGSYRSEGMTWYDAVQVLVIWKYMQSNWEAKRLCEEDAKRFLSARYRPWQFDIGIS